jgi:hypothetical protein
MRHGQITMTEKKEAVVYNEDCILGTEAFLACFLRFTSN